MHAYVDRGKKKQCGVMSPFLSVIEECTDDTPPGLRVPVTWDVEASGSTSLAFSWPLTAAVAQYFYELLYKGAVVDAGVLDRSSDGIRFLDLSPDYPYVFSLRAARYSSSVNRTQRNVGAGALGPEVLTAAQTAPAAELGLVTSQTVRSPVSGLPDVVDVDVVYADYNCVVDISVPTFTNAPDVWSGTVARLSNTLPITWRVTNVPYPETVSYMYLSIAGTIDSTCPYINNPGELLHATLQVEVPARPTPPSPACPAVTGLVQTGASGVTCLVYSWDAASGAVNGYAYTLTTAGTTIVAAASTKSTSVTITKLKASTQYSFSVSARCLDGDTGPSTTVTSVTAAMPVAVLPLPTTNSVALSTTGQPYTATIAYSGFENVTWPTLVADGASTAFGISITNGTPSSPVWRIENVPAGVKLSLTFTATQLLPGACENGAVVTSPAFTITTPTPKPGPPVPVPCPSTLVLVPALTVSSPASPACLTFTWGGVRTANVDTTQGYTYALYVGTVTTARPLVSSTLTYGASTVTLSGLNPGTVYSFVLSMRCSSGTGTRLVSCATTGTTSVVQPVALPAFDADAAYVTYLPPASGVSGMTVQFIYIRPTCVSSLSLSWRSGTEPSGWTGSITYNEPTWRITDVPAGTQTFVISGVLATTESDACTSCGSVPPAPIDVVLVVPAPVDPPTITIVDPGFTLALPHYAGPPKRIITLHSDTVPGDVTTIGTYYNLQALHHTYARYIVRGFIQYHQNKSIQISADMALSNLPISLIFFGNAFDPTSQGTITNMYNYAEYAAGASNDRNSFQYPPILEFFIELMTYNWEVANHLHSETAQPVQLALTHYGSDKTGEQWYFNCTIDEDGEIRTLPPSDPKAADSLVDGTPDDGGAGYAGWNCMERWFMHAAFLNQQLRKVIANGEIKCVTAIMTIKDIVPGTVTDPMYYQTSAITCDSEGNAFENTTNGTYTVGECNLLMKILWNKWFNQATDMPPLQSGSVSAFPSSWIVENLVAPHARKDGTTFLLPCKMSMSTPGLLQGMTDSDLNAPDYDAISHILHEIYDTSNSHPFYCVGADTVGRSSNCSSSGSRIQGAKFPNPSTIASMQKYVDKPETFVVDYGTWDNLVGTNADCGDDEGLAIVYGALVPSSDPGSWTVFNNSLIAVSPLMNTSVFNAWKDGSSTSWQLVTGKSSLDSGSLGYTLEASRYALYNGAWADAAARASNTVTNYTNVVQGQNGADGALLYTDLTTGVKPYLAGIVKSFSVTGKNGNGGRVALPGHVFMLSNEAGMFVNNMGVRITARVKPGTPYTFTAGDLMTFTCTDATWPGWTYGGKNATGQGMLGQYYGVGDSSKAGIMQQWALDQVQLGPYDPGFVGGTYVVDPTNATEDNFGVFNDIGIITAAWYKMALELKAGISTSALKYTTTPVMGCYELGFVPASWMDARVLFPAPS